MEKIINMNKNDSTEKYETILWNKLQLKADMFDYICWLENNFHFRSATMTFKGDERVNRNDRFIVTSDGTICCAKNYSDVVRIAMEHDKNVYDNKN